MAEKAELLERVEGVITGELVRLGARKQWSVHLLPLRQNVFGWIGLGQLTNCGPGHVGISPTVGVRHEQIESIVQRLSGIWKRPAPTISTNVGYLMPERDYIEWIFSPKPFDYTSEAQKVAAAIELYGLPFMKAHSSLEALIDDLESLRFTANESVRFRLPAAYLVAGNPELAITYVRQQLDNLGAHPVDVGRYEGFARSFIKEAESDLDHRRISRQ